MAKKSKKLALKKDPLVKKYLASIWKSDYKETLEAWKIWGDELEDLLEIENIDYQICYQSKVGRLKWTTPSLDEEIQRAGKDKIGVIIVPIAFVSEHSETLVELDIEYKELAKTKNIPFYYRVKALNSDAYFIEGLVQICKNISKKKQFCSNDNGERICPKNFKQCVSN